MQISIRAEYAAQAVLDIAVHATPRAGVRASDIAHRTGAPEKFLQAILLDLRKSGFVSSKRGPSGGHWLARPAARITVGAIVRAIDTAGASTTDRHRAPDSAGTALATVWAQADAAARSVLDDTTIEDLVRASHQQSSVDFSI